MGVHTMAIDALMNIIRQWVLKRDSVHACILQHFTALSDYSRPKKPATC